jgi:PKD repeat protein
MRFSFRRYAVVLAAVLCTLGFVGVVLAAPPAATFMISDTVPQVGQPVQFDSAVTDPAYTYDWDFGDGSPHGSGSTTTHAYGASGPKDVTLTITDPADGQTTSVTQTLGVNAPPTASFSFAGTNPITPAVPDVGELVNFSSSSGDSDGSISSYEWDLDGDGEFDDATVPNPSTSYTENGTFDVKLRVTDNAGGVAVADSPDVRVNALPTATFSYQQADLSNPGQNPQVPLVGAQVNFSGSSSDEEAGSRTYAWDFDNDGGFDDAAGSGSQHSFTSAGDRPVRLQVTDSDGATAVSTQTVRVNTAPRASFIFDKPTPITNEEITFAQTSDDPDPDGLLNPSNGVVITYEWDLNYTGSFDVDQTGPTFTHSYSTPGTKTVRLRVTDGGGARHETNRTITVENTRPSAAFTFSPLNPLPGQTVNFSSTSTPSPGKQIAANGVRWDFDYDRVTFTPDATGATVGHSFSTPGPKTVAIEVTESGGGTDIEFGTVVVNAPPQASFNVAPAGRFDGDSITFSSTSGDPDGPLTNYQWDLDDDGQYDASGPVVSRAYPSGAHTVRLQVTDSKGATATAERRIDVLKRPPKLLTGVKVTLFGNLTSKGVKLKGLVVRTPAKSTAKVTCKGSKCPKDARAASKRTATTKRLRFKSFERSFPAGTLITVTVTRPGYIGQHTTIKVRKGLRRYIRRDRCLRPGSSKPIACPDS